MSLSTEFLAPGTLTVPLNGALGAALMRAPGATAKVRAPFELTLSVCSRRGTHAELFPQVTAPALLVSAQNRQK